MALLADRLRGSNGKKVRHVIMLTNPGLDWNHTGR